MDDQPFTVSECPEFKELIKLCNEKAVLPSADTVRNDVLKLYKNYQTDVKYKLQVSLSYIFIYKIYNLLTFMFILFKRIFQVN